MFALALVTIVFAVFQARPAWTYVTGTEVTARVERCETEQRARGESTTCEGSWTLPGGERGSGTVEGAGEEDRGRTVTARASGDRATATSTGKLVASTALALALAVASIAFAALGTRKVLAARRRNP
ncbi:hypothetical protein [Actinomadura rugatobispora]|uniref:Uncharacterized protein n=1 Tax=Actinomadura rugatobispora TaxID=1994 RepID=A0ABW0ZTR6_9ACTN